MAYDSKVLRPSHNTTTVKMAQKDTSIMILAIVSEEM